ncbi:GNAT family N-acetyltransferase [uncultured Friedmanniella sp.]|uniref:GNAT family N-acetyltransferase n=1 Tax=uncultured Friedmanniella sp. TaxID=335381 RepID=UPI0035CC665C
MSVPVTRRTGEVTLRPWPLDVARALLAGRPLDGAETARWHPGYPMTGTTMALAVALGAYEVDGPLTAAPAWWLLQIERDGEVVGDVGFHGPPAGDGPAEVEIGYGVVPALRGQGIATRACALALELAWRQGADTVVAGTVPDNLASRTVLTRCGFSLRLDGDFAIRRPR